MESQQCPSDVPSGSKFSAKTDEVQKILKFKHALAYNIQSRTSLSKFLSSWLVPRVQMKSWWEGKRLAIFLTQDHVPTIPESSCKQYLFDQEIKPLHHLLEVEGANGQLVPYFGCVEITLTFPKDFLEDSIGVTMLTLLCLIPHSPSWL